MLKKLLKYEILHISKFLLIFYTLSLIFATLTRIFLNIENSLMMNIVGQVCSGVCISMMANILINNIMRLWFVFKKKLYGDESYLTHTLPVSKRTLYLSRCLNSLITLFISFIVILLSLFIAYYSKENLLAVKKLLIPLVNMYDSTIVKFILICVAVFFLEIINLLQVGYTGIIIGHRFDNNKVGYSILFAFVTYVFIQIFALIVMFIFAIFNKDMMNLFITNEMVNLTMVKYVMYIATFIYTLSIGIVYYINVKLFEKGVNIE